MRLNLVRMGSLAVVAALALCLTGCAKADEQTQAVIDRIDAIGEVTLGSKADIESIRRDYDKLPDDQAKFVENLDKLESAEDKIGDLEAKAKASQTTTTGKTASSVGSSSSKSSASSSSKSASSSKSSSSKKSSSTKEETGRYYDPKTGGTLYTYSDGTEEYTDGWGNAVRGKNGKADEYTTDGGETWHKYED